METAAVIAQGLLRIEYHPADVGGPCIVSHPDTY